MAEDKKRELESALSDFCSAFQKINEEYFQDCEDNFQFLRPENLAQKLQKEIGELGLSNEAFNLCREAGFKIVNDLVQLSKADLRCIFSEYTESDIAWKAAREIHGRLLALGLKPGLKEPYVRE